MSSFVTYVTVGDMLPLWAWGFFVAVVFVLILALKVDWGELEQCSGTISVVPSS